MDLRTTEALRANRFTPESTWASGRTAAGSGSVSATPTASDHRVSMVKTKELVEAPSATGSFLGPS